MKNIKYIFATIILGTAITSCGDSFLTQNPEGGTLLQEQFEKLPDNLNGLLLGTYAKLYEYGSDHDEFGQRSIDMYGDIQCGDMALKKANYGWFSAYENGYFYSEARGYIWSFYYGIINLTNRGDIAVDEDYSTIIGSIGTPVEDLPATIKLQGYCYGQLLALRGWAYSNLLNYYCDPMDQLSNPIDLQKAIPLYTKVEIAKKDQLGEPRSTIMVIYDQIYKDLSDAIDLLDYYGQCNSRNSKLEIDADVARIMLAYAMLNLGDQVNSEGKDITFGSDSIKPYDIALKLASEAISHNKYPLLKKSELCSTGFSDVSAKNWMWGEDVAVETTTKLASFFGQCDIHSYSYAAAGDTKAIDSKLYDDIATMGWDARINWFRSGGKGVSFPYCPDGKFFNPGTKHTTSLREVDRNWLCDNVYMRIEVAYLIAAEAAYRRGEAGDEAIAASYLKQLCDERVLDGKDAEYAAWLATLSGNALKDAIIYNWRVEMWGEGYGLQTLRRLSKQVELGENHLTRKKQTLDVASKAYQQFQCEIPTSESRYNPFIGTNELTKDN
ncbi:MAG: RagB/SusD family nutrient uptake outer membrane protein [Paludibacteraceae bacterium]|nr:RagB/SusD family nutrient uptake outer membrane protein [Paludibacteraceae bacterium]